MADYIYANVIVDISHEKVDRPFQYRIPDRLIGRVDVGSPVNIPFGRGNNVRKGYVIELTDEPQWEVDKIKEILDVAEDTVSAEDLSMKLAAWMKRHYGSTMNAALRTVIPSGKKQNRQVHKYVSLRLPEREATEYYYECARKKQTARERILKELLDNPGDRIPYELITSKLNVTSATLKSLSDKGIIRIDSEEYFRNPVAAETTRYGQKVLSDEQQNIVDSVVRDYDEGKRETYLIHGITGSGKTEVYIALIDAIVKKGRQAIVLIPEIALTYQTLMRFYHRFGDRVSVIHSRMSEGERFDQFERAKNGDIDVMIGPRSALFTPFPHLGIIVIDEEHEESYRSGQSPRYHAREVAFQRGRMENAKVVLGSATPSLEASWAGRRGELTIFKLNQRARAVSLPEVSIADLRTEPRDSTTTLLSRPLRERMEDCLGKGDQMMLFLNRRGYAGFVTCRSCGHVIKCPHCDVSLTLHASGRLACHYCGYETPMPDRCPECGSIYLRTFRAGTEQVEEEVTRLFPQARVLRMDRDTTTAKDAQLKILSAFASHEADILIGTQMIVKGHDFPDVTLVGILLAEYPGLPGGGENFPAAHAGCRPGGPFFQKRLRPDPDLRSGPLRRPVRGQAGL